MCITLLVETVEYYVSNDSSVYVLLIDRAKAFDNLNSNAESGRLSFIPAMDVHGIAKCTINKKSAKLIAIYNIPLPHTHIIIYCNELNSNKFCKCK